MDLHPFFNPRSIAIIGASADPVGISGRPLRILQQHSFGGALYPINPKYPELRGLKAYPRIGDVPEPVDLALLTVPARLVPGLLEECAVAGVRFAMVFSSGFAEAGEAGRALQDEVRRVVDRTALRVIGPNCEGYFNLAAGIAAGFSPTIDPNRAYRPSTPGPVGIVAQSGGLGFALFNRGLEQGLGFSTVISNGNDVDLTTLDYLEYLVDDPATRVILAFVEGIKDERRLGEVADRARAAAKPLIVAKMGRSAAGARAAGAHTGSQVGSDEAHEAAFRQHGIIRVHDVDEMLDAAAYFSGGRRPAGRRVAILTVSGGAGAWLADACVAHGLEVPELEPELQAELQALLPSYGSALNPVDATAQALAHGGVEQSLRIMARSRRIDTIVTVLPLASNDTFEAALPGFHHVLDSTDLTMVHYSYTTPLPETLDTLRTLGVPCYPSPGRAARALAWACWYADFLRR